MVDITMLKKKYFSFLFIFLIFLFDRFSKFLILKVSQPLDYFNLPVTSFLNLNLIWNDGIAFGLFSFDDILYYHLLTLLIVLILSF